jgi:hypothetical protein
MLSKKMYAVVRKTGGNEWIDGASVQVLPDMAQHQADADDARLGHWCKHNPQVRLIEVRVTEVRPGT